MTIIQKVTQEEMIKKFSELAQNSLGTQLSSEHVAVVSEREHAKIKAVSINGFIDELKKSGINFPVAEDVALVTIADMDYENKKDVQEKQKKTTPKFKR